MTQTTPRTNSAQQQSMPLCTVWTPDFRCESTVQLQRLAHSDSFCLILPPNLKSAIEAVTYMADQLKKQDTDDSVRTGRCRDAQAERWLITFVCSDDRRLAVHRPGGGPPLPLVVRHHYHPGHPGHLLRCQFQLHTWRPLSMKDKTDTPLQLQKLFVSNHTLTNI